MVLTLAALLPYAYCFNFLFKDEKRALTVSTLVNSMGTLFFALPITIIKFIVMDKPEAFLGLTIADTVLRLLPMYNLASTLTTAGVFSVIQSVNGHPIFTSFSYHFLGVWLLMLVLGLLFWWLLLFAVEKCGDSMLQRGVG